MPHHGCDLGSVWVPHYKNALVIQGYLRMGTSVLCVIQYVVSYLTIYVCAPVCSASPCRVPHYGYLKRMILAASLCILVWSSVPHHNSGYLHDPQCTYIPNYHHITFAFLEKHIFWNPLNELFPMKVVFYTEFLFWNFFLSPLKSRTHTYFT